MACRVLEYQRLSTMFQPFQTFIAVSEFREQGHKTISNFFIAILLERG